MQKTKEDHLQAVASILADQFGINESDIALDKNLYTDLGADSLDAVELVMAIEEECGIEIKDDEAMKFQTVAHIVDYLVLHAGES